MDNNITTQLEEGRLISAYEEAQTYFNKIFCSVECKGKYIDGNNM